MPVFSTELATKFIIKTLTGANAGVSLVLSDRSLPYRGYALPSAMRVQKTSYPGNPVATMQVLGSEEKETTISGYWKQRFLGTSARYNNSPIVFVADLVAQMQQIKDAGQLVEVLWGDTVRRGVITNFKPTWQYSTDCEWELEFSWSSRGQDPPENVLSSSAYLFALQSAAITASNALDAVQRLINAARIPTDWLDGPLAFIDGVRDSTQIVRNGVSSQLSNINIAVGTALQAAGALQGAAMLPADIGNALASTISNQASNIETTAQSMSYRSQLAYTRLWQNITATVQTADSIATDLSVSTATVVAAAKASVLYTAATIGLARHKSLGARRTLVESAADHLTIKGNGILAVYTAKAHDDLRRVSIMYYGTQSGWLDILKFNHLTSPELHAGQVILIPALAGIA